MRFFNKTDKAKEEAMLDEEQAANKTEADGNDENEGDKDDVLVEDPTGERSYRSPRITRR